MHSNQLVEFFITVKQCINKIDCAFYKYPSKILIMVWLDSPATIQVLSTFHITNMLDKTPFVDRLSNHYVSLCQQGT